MEILESAKTKLGNTIELIGEPEENNVLIIGVVHGDEPQGKYLIEGYITEFIKFQPPLPNPPPPRGREVSPQISYHTQTLQKRNEILEYKKNQYTEFALQKSKELRKKMTDAEGILWYFLRAKRFFGYKFRRQQAIGKYIVDFVCQQKKLVIELDGSQHGNSANVQYDKKRTKFIENKGYNILRFWDNDIFENITGVLEKILGDINCQSSIPFCGSGLEQRVYRQDSLPPGGGGLGRGGWNNLLFIPCLNPDGMQLNRRTNANNVDINRNFPTKNWGKNEGDNATCDDETTNYFGGKSPASEIETQFVIDIIEKYKPKLILTLHAPYKVVNYDGPARETAEKISKIINYPVEASIGYPTPGSFGTWAGVERNIPIITLELDEEIPVEELVSPAFEIFDYLKND